MAFHEQQTVGVVVVALAAIFLEVFLVLAVLV
jgi:hypothetical protein